MYEVVISAIKAVVKIKGVVDKFRRNNKDCEKIYGYVNKLSTDLKKLQEAPIMEHPTVHDAMEHLKEALESTASEIQKCQSFSAIRQFLQANDIASNLDRLRDDVSDKMLSAVLFITENTNSLVRSMDHKMDQNYISLMKKIEESYGAIFAFLGPIFQVR